MTVFIDTSAFYALFNRDDPNHKQAARFYQQAPASLMTTHAVFTEILSLLTKRQGKGTALRCGKEIKGGSARLQIFHMDVAQEERAWQLFCKFKDKEFDLVDCLSFVCMEDHDIEEAFTFDRHFVQYGFRMVP